MPRRAQSALVQLYEGNVNNKTKKELNKRIKNEKKLTFDTDKLVPPNWLSTGAKKVFKDIVDMYSDTSFLNNADLVTLTQYCDWYSEYRACNNRLKKNGRVIGDKTNPDLNVKLKISAELDRLAKELGLTPAARASLAIHLNDEDNKDTDDEFDD